MSIYLDEDEKPPVKSVEKAGHSGLGKDVELVDLSGSGESIIIVLSLTSEAHLSQFVYA